MNRLSLTELDAHIDRKIEDARRRGEFDNLPGTGQPLDLDEDLSVPPEVRMANRILKNSGFVPAELQDLTELNQLIAAIERNELSAADDEQAGRRVRALLAVLEQAGHRTTAQKAWHDYQSAVTARLSSR